MSSVHGTALSPRLTSSTASGWTGRSRGSRQPFDRVVTGQAHDRIALLLRRPALGLDQGLACPRQQ
jgi:hypothetical protein